MILKHPPYPLARSRQLQYPYRILRGHGHGTITGLSELGAAPCVDGTGFATCRHLGCRRAVADPAAKFRLHRSHRTVAVDVEFHVAARIATARNLSFAACRVILDPASRRLPPAWSRSVVTEHPIRAVFCVRSPAAKSKSAGY
jgi:hypothetical protein